MDTAPFARALAVIALATGTLLTNPARAAFHLWTVTEVYSNSSGSLQFIELSSNASTQNFVNGQSISISNVGGTQTHSLILPGNALPGSTVNKFLLLGTAGLHAAGAPTPDYIITDGFLFTAGGTLNFFGANGGGYTALPVDGTLARIWNGGNTANVAVNYAGQSSSVVVPEPVTAGLVTAAASALFLGMRRQRTRAR